MSVKANEEVVSRWVAAWLEGDLDVLDTLFSADYTVNGRLIGVEGVKQGVQLFHSGLSDLAIEVNDIISDGDKVVARWTVRGMHTGNFIGVLPTNTPLELTGTNIYQISDGKIAANHEQTNIPETLARLKMNSE